MGMLKLCAVWAIRFLSRVFFLLHLLNASAILHSNDFNIPRKVRYLRWLIFFSSSLLWVCLTLTLFFHLNLALSWILNNIPRALWLKNKKRRISFAQIYFRWIVLFLFDYSIPFVVDSEYVLHIEIWLCSTTNLWIGTRCTKDARWKKCNNMPISWRCYGYFH